MLIFKKLTAIIFITVFMCAANAHPYICGSVHAIIFDCDGVLVDTENLKFKAWQQALKEENIAFSVEEYIPLVGYASSEILTRIVSNKNINDTTFHAIISRKNQIYKELHLKGVPVFQEAIDFLKEVVSKKSVYGYKVAIVSSAPRSEIILNMKHAHINIESLDLIASGEDDLNYIQDTEKNKPKPYIYQFAAEFLKVNPKNCIVFEDTYAGVCAAYRANMCVFAVPNAMTVQQDFSNAIDVITFKNLNLEALMNRMSTISTQPAYTH